MSVRRRFRRVVAAATALGGAAAAATAATFARPRLKQPRLRRRRAVYQYRRRLFNLRQWSDEKVLLHYCFTKQVIRRPLPFLGLDEICWTNGIRPAPTTAFWLFLVRLAFLGRLLVIADHFGRSSTWYSAVQNNVAIRIFTKFRRILEWHPLLNYERMALFAGSYL